MISLKNKGTPNAIEVYGCAFLLDTDYRVWLDFPKKMSDAVDGDSSGYYSLFADKYNVPLLVEETVAQLEAFFYREPVVPKDRKKTGNVLDYDIDADMIYAAFMQAYGIDLVECDLHWHKFSALLNGLPDNTLLSKVIGYRTYDGKDKELKELRNAWSLPIKYTEEEKEALETFNKFFG